MHELGECPNNTENLKAVDANDEKSYAKLEKQFREARENERAFQAELAAVINKYSREGRSNTPDFILAGYLVNCLEAYEAAMDRRNEWFGGLE